MRTCFGKSNRLGSALLATLLYVLSALPAVPVWAQQPINFNPVRIPRRILALYKSSEGRTPEKNEIYRLAQLPLNNLGLVVDYADAEGELPSPSDMAEYRGVLTWFVSDQMKNAHRFRSWLLQVARQGRRIVIFDQFGAYREAGQQITRADVRETQQVLGLLGLVTELRTWVDDDVRIKYKDPSFFDYEAQLKPQRFHYIFDVLSIDSANRVLLTLSRGDLRNDAAVLTPRGGYVQSGATHWLDESSGRAQWLINPFKFFAAAFGYQNVPAADLNTAGGHRLAFLHVDGDGFSTISKIDHWHLSAELLRSRVLSRFSLPFSVSVIAAEVDSAYLGSQQTVRAARQIFALPNVEPASHSFSHPLDWRRGIVSFDSIPGYRFDPEQEIHGSMSYIERELLLGRQPVSLFFWSGACNPTADQIRRVEQHGWLQINGGGGFLDPDRPSVTAFAPPYAFVGDQIRINARLSNEFELTNGWRGPYDGFKKLVASLEFTNQKERLIPADIYFHHYIMEWKDGWESLRYVLRWVEHQDWTFVYTSQYVRMVKDFLSTEIQQLAPDRYLVRTQGALRTIRFANESRRLDPSRSRNLVGFTRKDGDLLVYLDARKVHEIVFGSPQEKVPYVSSATRLIDSLAVRQDTLQLDVRGYGEADIVLANLAPQRYYRVLASNQGDHRTHGQTVSQVEAEGGQSHYVRSDANGSVRIRVFIPNRATLTITPSTPTAYVFSHSKMWLLGTILIGFVLLEFRRFSRRDPLEYERDGGEETA